MCNNNSFRMQQSVLRVKTPVSLKVDTDLYIQKISREVSKTGCSDTPMLFLDCAQFEVSLSDLVLGEVSPSEDDPDLPDPMSGDPVSCLAM